MPCKCKVLRLIPSIPLQKKIFGNHVPPKATIRNVDISEGVQQDPGECAVQALERKRTCGQRQEGVWQVQACLALHLGKKSGCSGEDDGGMSTDTRTVWRIYGKARAVYLWVLTLNLGTVMSHARWRAPMD